MDAMLQQIPPVSEQKVPSKEQDTLPGRQS